MQGVMQTLPCPAPAPPVTAPWRHAAGQLLVAWRDGAPAPIERALEDAARACVPCDAADQGEQERRELAGSIVAEMRRAGGGGTDPETGLWIGLLAHLAGGPVPPRLRPM